MVVAINHKSFWRDKLIIFGIGFAVLSAVLIIYRDNILNREDVQLKEVSQLAQNNTKSINIFNKTADTFIGNQYKIMNKTDHLDDRLDAGVDILDNISKRLLALETLEHEQHERDRINNLTK